ncbi:MAG: hypothetical protein LW865_01565 [Betaproteobacteria bacterium]|jgi:conjugal transfer/entry exclusion protein|nr:hypothetical protein [Betaproteobacteria bacterium]
MIKTWKKLTAALVVASFGVSSLHSHAMTVFDPMNYSQTTVSAIRAVKAELDRAVQIKQQWDQYAEMLRQAKNLTNVGTLLKDAVKAEIAVNEYTKEMYSLYGNVQQAQTLFEKRYALNTSAGRAGIRDFTKRAEGIYKTAQEHSKALKQEVQLQEAIVDNQKKISAMQDNIPGLDSTQKSLTQMNAQLGLLVQQQQQYMAYQVAMSQAQNRPKEDRLVAETVEAEQADARQKAGLALMASQPDFAIPSVKPKKN